MSEYLIDLIKRLHGCTFLPGSSEKRFIRQMRARSISEPEKPLTEKQMLYLGQIQYRYRKQLGEKQ